MVDRLRKWWSRSGVLTLAGVLALVLGWWLRQTGGGLVTEVFSFVTLPFGPPEEAQTPPANAQVGDLQNRVALLEQENAQLRALMALEPPPGAGAPIAARVIGRSSDHWWQEVVLNRGSVDGVEVGAAVMSIGGLVGRITQVSPHASRVLLLSDPTSQVGVMVVRNRTMGILQGRRRESAVLEPFEPLPLKKGDLVVTSGLSSRFPPGLPVGTVTRYDRSQASMKAEIAFSAPLGRLEYVKIFRAVPPDADLPAPSTP